MVRSSWRDIEEDSTLSDISIDHFKLMSVSFINNEFFSWYVSCQSIPPILILSLRKSFWSSLREMFSNYCTNLWNDFDIKCVKMLREVRFAHSGICGTLNTIFFIKFLEIKFQMNWKISCRDWFIKFCTHVLRYCVQANWSRKNSCTFLKSRHLYLSKMV